MKVIKECCNSNCKEVFYVKSYEFHSRDLCDKCIINNDKKTNK